MLIKTDRLIRVKNIITNAFVIFFFVEIIFFPQLENIVAAIVLLSGWYLISTVVLTPYKMIHYPVSFLMFLGFALFLFIAPIPLTLLEFKPVTYNLKVPITTFIHHFLFVSVIVVTHSIYVTIAKGENLFRPILKRNNFYGNVTNNQIWFISILGLAFSYYKFFVFGVWQSGVEDRNLMFYLAGIFSQFLWMPVIIPLIKNNNNGSINKRQQKIYIIIYTSLVVLLCIASNVRTLLFSGLFTFMFVYIIYLLYGRYNINKNFSQRKLFTYFIIAAIVSGPVTNFSFAMVALRQSKYNLSGSELLDATLKLYQDDQKMSELKALFDKNEKGELLLSKNWNEVYLSNSVSNRFCSFKIADNCLFYAQKIGYENPSMRQDFDKQIIANLPNFLINFFGMSQTEKNLVYSYSVTDYLYSLAIKNSSVRGSFIIGSMPGVGMAIFGYWYLLVCIPLFLIIFTMFDSFVYVVKGQIYFSFYFYTMIFTIVDYFNDRHVYQYEFRYICRTYFEEVFLFIITMYFVRLVVPCKNKS